MSPEAPRWRVSVREAVLDLLLARGPLASTDPEDRARHAARIDWTLRNDRWACAAGPDGELIGWLGWVRTNGAGHRWLKRFRTASELARHARYLPTDRGSYLFLTDATLATGAPPRVLRALVREALRRNPGVRVVCWRQVARPAKKSWRAVRLRGSHGLRYQQPKEPADAE